MSDFKFGLGDKVGDKVTGFTGVIVGRGDHISGCNTYGIQPLALKDGQPQDVKWLDEPRLLVMEAGFLVGIDQRESKTGADSVPQSTRAVPE